MIDPKDFSLSLGNIVATYQFIEKINKEFEALHKRIEELEASKQQAAPQVAKKSAAKAV